MSVATFPPRIHDLASMFNKSVQTKTDLDAETERLNEETKRALESIADDFVKRHEAVHARSDFMSKLVESLPPDTQSFYREAIASSNAHNHRRILNEHITAGERTISKAQSSINDLKSALSKIPIPFETQVDKDGSVTYYASVGVEGLGEIRMVRSTRSSAEKTSPNTQRGRQSVQSSQNRVTDVTDEETAKEANETAFSDWMKEHATQETVDPTQRSRADRSQDRMKLKSWLKNSPQDITEPTQKSSAARLLRMKH